MTLPLRSVWVMEDRAQLERQGEITLAPGSGTTRVEVAGVSPLAVDRSLQVQVQGASLVDARLVRRWKEKPAGGLAADATELRRAVKNLEEEREARRDAVDRLERQRELLAVARADLLRAIAEHVGVGTVDETGWKRQLALLGLQQREVDEKIRQAQFELERAQRRLGETQTALHVAEQPVPELECSLVMTLEGSGQARVRVTYMVPCAAWRPAYRATLLKDRLLLETEAVVWQRTGEAWNGVQMMFSTLRPTLGTTPPVMTEDVLRTRPDEKRRVEVALREEIIPTTGEGTAASELPGLDDGGESRFLEGPGGSSVPSDGEPHRVPLGKFEGPAELEWVISPELSYVASRIVRFANTSGRVLLAGPVDLIRQGGFIGRSVMGFTAAGETVKLSFGSEDGLTVIRNPIDKEEESRITGRRTKRREVWLYVSNARLEPVRLVIEERVPVSEVKEVEVKVLQADCTPKPESVSPKGIARIPVSLAAHGNERVKLVWELSAASKVEGV